MVKLIVLLNYTAKIRQFFELHKHFLKNVLKKVCFAISTLQNELYVN